MSSIPEIVVSYGNRGDSTCVAIGITPSLELKDEEVEEAATNLYSFLRSAFHLSLESKLTLHETETGRTLSHETFRDPSFVSNFPRYWYLTASANGYNATASIASVFQSLSGDDSTFPSTEYSELSDLLLMDGGYSPPDPDLNEVEFGEEDDEDPKDLDDMYPSLMQLSMGQSLSQELDTSREDLMLMSLTADINGHFGAVFRHFTVVASILRSDNSTCSDGSDSRTNSRSSVHSTDSLYTTLNMSSLFVSTVVSGGAADIAGLQPGDIVRMINGQSVSGSTPEDITSVIEDSSKKLILSVSPEKHDELLFLYPQYISEQPGEYDSGGNEKIIIVDIVAKTLSLLSPTTDEEPSIETTPINQPRFHSDSKPKHIRPLSADCNRITTTKISSDDNYHCLDITSPPLDGGSSEQSLSSGIEYNSSIEDLLIRGSLADIPVENSPIQPHKRSFEYKDHLNAKNSLDDKLSGGGSQNWLSENEIRWFPKADEEHPFAVSLPVANGSLSNDMTSPSGEFPSAFVEPPIVNAKKSKLAHKLKQTIKSLTGTSSNAHPKLEKSHSLSIVKTHSTSAIDRLKISNTSNLSDRSRSTDLGKIKLNRSSLEALTKVGSEESILRRRTEAIQKQNSYDGSQNKSLTLPPLSIDTQAIPTLDFVHVPSTSPTDFNVDKAMGMANISPGSTQYQLTPEGKNLSGDSMNSGTGQKSSKLGGRSYRSQRQRLYQTKNPKSIGDSEKDLFTSSMVESSSSRTLNLTPSSSRTYLKEKRSSPSLGKKPPARRTSSWQNRGSFYKLSNDSYSSQDKIYNFSLDESNVTTPYVHRNHPRAGDSHLQSHSRSHSVIETMNLVNEERGRVNDGRGSVEPTINRHQQVRPHSSGGKMSAARRAMSVHPHGDTRSNSLSYDPHNCDENLSRLRAENKMRRSVTTQPDKFTSVFHGPIHKKQEKDVGGKKPPDRSWRALYAAIQKHRMVFYGSVQDALANNPLSAEPPLDLHQCMVRVMTNGYKNRKNVFRLSCVLDGSECIIQSENEESMMTWMRIIHNLNRTMRTRMGPPIQPHRISTQEDVPKSQQLDKRKIYRLLTPQPPTKKRSSHETKDDSSRRQQLLEKLKRVKKNKKEVVEDVDVPCYNTFGKPIEDCPASYENKSIPLVVMVCVKELEQCWMDTEGLYRIAGPIGQVRTLAQELNKGHFNLLQGHHDPHVITAIMKKFLKELPDPLVPLNKYNDFILCSQLSDPQEKVRYMKELVEDLPSCHYHTLGFLIRHLINVSTQHETNKMNQHNLAIVFGPTVAHKAGNEVVVNEMSASISVIKILMDNIDSFFSKVDFGIFYKQQQNSTGRHPFIRGRSDPMNGNSQYEYYGARSQSPRKSWDGTSINSLSRNNLTVGSQDAFLLSYTDGFSQDLRSRTHHKKRLASSRGKLAYIEEPQKDLTSPTLSSTSTSTLPSPITPGHTSSSNNVVSPKRKISYTSAVSRAWDAATSADMLQSVSEDNVTPQNSRTDFSYAHSSSVSHTDLLNRRISAVTYGSSQRNPKGSLHYSDLHHRRWSTVDPTSNSVEIVGPSSASNSEWLSRSRRSEQNLLKGPESCL